VLSSRRARQLHLHKTDSSAGICPVTAALSDILANYMQPLATLAASSVSRVFQHCLVLTNYASFVLGTVIQLGLGALQQ
jgi:hypothetical protein